MATSPLFQTFERLRGFFDQKNPFQEHHLLNLEMAPDAFAAYKTQWLEEKAFFAAQTGHNYPSLDCMSGWATRNATALFALPRNEQVDLAVWAAGTYQPGMLKLLLRHDPSLAKTRDHGGDTVLHAAAASQDPYLLLDLLPRDPGAVRTLTDQQGMTPVQRLILARKNDPRWPARFGLADHNSCIRIMGDACPPALREPFNDGSTALHLAAGLQYPMGPCKAIVAAGGQWNRPDNAGRTPAQALAENQGFQPKLDGKSQGQRREARWRQEALAAGDVPWEQPFMAQAKAGLRKLLGSR